MVRWHHVLKAASSLASRVRPIARAISDDCVSAYRRIRPYAGRPIPIFKKLCFYIGLLNLLGALSAVVVSVIFVSSLPAVDGMSFSDLRSRVKRQVEQKLGGNNSSYAWVAIERISDQFKYSVIASEDSTFFEHSGFNVEAIIDSVAENIRERRAAFGASTISQQVVKNIFLTREKTLTRKVRELLITISMEKRFTKNQILELYLNLAEFGPEIYGVYSAAKHYFHKPPSRINAAEGVFLALMLPAPKRYYDTIYQEQRLTKLKRKRIERVLRDMLYDEYITEEQYKASVGYNYFNTRSPTSPDKRSIAGK